MKSSKTTHIEFSEMPEKQKINIEKYLNRDKILRCYLTEYTWSSPDIISLLLDKNESRHYIIITETKLITMDENSPYTNEIRSIEFSDIGNIGESESDSSYGKYVQVNINFKNRLGGVRGLFCSQEFASEFIGFVNEQKDKDARKIPGENLVEQLEKLADLHRCQVITDEEFAAAKKRLGL